MYKFYNNGMLLDKINIDRIVSNTNRLMKCGNGETIYLNIEQMKQFKGEILFHYTDSIDDDNGNCIGVCLLLSCPPEPEDSAVFNTNLLKQLCGRNVESC